MPRSILRVRTGALSGNAIIAGTQSFDHAAGRRSWRPRGGTACAPLAAFLMLPDHPSGAHGEVDDVAEETEDAIFLAGQMRRSAFDLDPAGAEIDDELTAPC